MVTRKRIAGARSPGNHSYLLASPPFSAMSRCNVLAALLIEYQGFSRPELRCTFERKRVIRCSNYSANLRYPNPAGRTLSLLHKHQVAWVRISMPIRSDEYTSIMIHKEI